MRDHYQQMNLKEKLNGIKNYVIQHAFESRDLQFCVLRDMQFYASRIKIHFVTCDMNKFYVTS